MENLYAVIFAGGTGTRLWPISRQSQPKQLQPFGEDEETLLQKTWQRVRRYLPADHIYVSTVKDCANFLTNQLPELLADNLIVEPALKNTGPAIGLAAMIIEQCHPGSFITNVWADQYYTNEDEFVSVINKSWNYLQSHPEVTMSVGLNIEYPCTGYGYLEVEPKSSDEILTVCRFVEKPDLIQAAKFMEAGNYYWNPAIFMWQTAYLLKLYQQFTPDIYNGLEKIKQHIGQTDYQMVLEATYLSFPKIALEPAILEQGPPIKLIPAVLGWKDMGSWQSIYEVLKGDTTTPVASKGKTVILDCQDTLVFNMNDKQLVTVVGLQDIAIINTPDALLVIPKSRGQEVKQLVEELKTKEMTEYL